MKYEDLLQLNRRINSYKALIYSFNLSSSRFVEYVATLDYLKLKAGEKVLDIGSGRSILPTLLTMESMHPCVAEIDRNCLTWQNENTIGEFKGRLSSVLSSGEHLPFRNESFHAVTAISVLEHLSGQADVKCAEEIGRILKPKGISIITVPATAEDTTIELASWTTCVPHFSRLFFGKSLKALLRKLKLERSEKYLIRLYCLHDLVRRIVKPSGCILQDYLTLSSRVATLLYDVFLPPVVAPLEYLLAKKFVSVGKSNKNIGGVILKLRKP